MMTLKIRLVRDLGEYGSLYVSNHSLREYVGKPFYRSPDRIVFCETTEKEVRLRGVIGNNIASFFRIPEKVRVCRGWLYPWFVFPSIIDGVYGLFFLRRGADVLVFDGYVIDDPLRFARARGEWYGADELLLLKRFFGGDFASIVEGGGAVNLYGERGAGKTFAVLSSVVSSEFEWFYVRFDPFSRKLILERVGRGQRHVITEVFPSFRVLREAENVVLDDVHYMWELGGKAELERILEDIAGSKRIIVVTDEPLWYFEERGLRVPFKYVFMALASTGASFWRQFFGVEDKGWMPGFSCPINGDVEVMRLGYVPVSRRLSVCVFSVLAREGKPYYRNVFALADELGLLEGRARAIYNKYRALYEKYYPDHNWRAQRAVLRFIRSVNVSLIVERVSEVLSEFFLGCCTGASYWKTRSAVGKG